MCDYIIPLDTPLKRCSKCGEMKPATAEFFTRNKNAPDGLASQCKECRAAYYAANRKRIIEAAHIWYIANRERRKKYDRAYSAANSNRIVERIRKWREANPERYVENNRARYEANKEQVAKYSRAYRKEHPEVDRAHGLRRRALKRDAEGAHTATDIQAQYKRQNGKCYYCGQKVGKNYHVDHIVPLSRGGSNGPENLVIACPTCNLRKSDKLPHEWPEGGRLL